MDWYVSLTAHICISFYRVKWLCVQSKQILWILPHGNVLVWEEAQHNKWPRASFDFLFVVWNNICESYMSAAQSSRTVFLFPLLQPSNPRTWCGKMVVSFFTPLYSHFLSVDEEIQSGMIGSKLGKVTFWHCSSIIFHPAWPLPSKTAILNRRPYGSLWGGGWHIWTGARACNSSSPATLYGSSCGLYNPDSAYFSFILCL